MLEILDLVIPLFILLLKTHPGRVSVGRGERAKLNQKYAKSCSEDKITQFLLLAFPTTDSFPETPLSEKGRFSICQVNGPFWGRDTMAV